MADLNQGQSYSYNDNPSRAGTYTHAWTFSDGTASGTGNPINHTWPNVGPVTATATATDAYGTIRTASRTDNVIGIQDGANSMAVARANPSVIQLANGKILISGGWTNPSMATTETCELFDPSNGTFTNTGSMSAGRAYHRLTLLPDGRVFAAGGCVGAPMFTSGGFDGMVTSAGPLSWQVTTCEIYDPTSGTWSGAASMPSRRLAHRQFLGTHGKVVAVGGYDPASPATYDVYDPALNTWATISTIKAALVDPEESHIFGAVVAGSVVSRGGFGFDFENPWGPDATIIGGQDSAYHWDSLTPTRVAHQVQTSADVWQDMAYTVRGQIISKGRYADSYGNGIFALDDDGITSIWASGYYAATLNYSNYNAWNDPDVPWPVNWEERSALDRAQTRYGYAGSFRAWDGNIYHIGGQAETGPADYIRRSRINTSASEFVDVGIVPPPYPPPAPYIPHDVGYLMHAQPLWEMDTSLVPLPTIAGLSSAIGFEQRLIHSVDRKKFYLIGGGQTTSTIKTNVLGFNLETGTALSAITPTTPRHMPGMVRMTDGKWFLVGGFANIGSPTALSSYAYAMF